MAYSVRTKRILVVAMADQQAADEIEAGGILSGQSVTQLTSRTTAVATVARMGRIITNNASLGAELAASFTVTNPDIKATDIVVVAIAGGSNGGNTKALVTSVADGSFVLTIANDNAAGGAAETGAISINWRALGGSVTIVTP